MNSSLRAACAAIAVFAGGGALYAGPVVLPTGNFQCIINTGSNSTCADGQVSQIVGSGLSFSLSAGAAWQGSGTLTEGTQGAVSGAIPIGTLIPFGYDFNLDSASEGASNPTWQLTISIVDTTGGVNIVLNQSFNGMYSTIPTDFSNSGTIATTAAVANGDAISVSYQLALTNQAGILNTVQVPGATSVDIGPVSAASTQTPEPSTVAMIGGGLGLLALAARRRWR